MTDLANVQGTRGGDDAALGSRVPNRGDHCGDSGLLGTGRRSGRYREDHFLLVSDLVCSRADWVAAAPALVKNALRGRNHDFLVKQALKNAFGKQIADGEQTHPLMMSHPTADNFERVVAIAR